MVLGDFYLGYEDRKEMYVTTGFILCDELRDNKLRSLLSWENRIQRPTYRDNSRTGLSRWCCFSGGSRKSGR